MGGVDPPGIPHREIRRYYGPENQEIDYPHDFILDDCDAGRWVAVNLPSFLVLDPEPIRPRGSAKKEIAPYSACLREILHPAPVPAHVDLDEELRQRIEEEAQSLPFPDACLVKRLDAMRDFMPRSRSANSGDRFLIPAPRWIWEGDLVTQLAVITQSSENIWLRSKRPILHRIRREHAHMAILLPKGFSDPHIRKVHPRCLKEVQL